MRERGFTLRTLLVTITLCVTGSIAAAVGVLAVVTQTLKRSSIALADSVEHVRASEETQIALLMHAGATDRTAEGALEGEMAATLQAMRQDASSPAASERVARAEAMIQNYLASARAGSPRDSVGALHGAAYRVLDEVSDLYVQQARELRDTAVLWDRRLDWLGSAGVVAAVACAVWLLLWMQRQAFDPLFALSQVMHRFGQGDYAARAEERGPAELRGMAELFNQMASTLAAQRRAQVAFLGGVAHDLRNPLSALHLSLDTIGPNQPPPTEPRLRRTVEIAQRQLRKLERMVSDLMDMTKVDAGTLELRLEQHDLRGVVQEVVSSFEATGPEHHIELQLPSESVAVRCDGLRVEQIVTNLVSNALKYSPTACPIEVSLTRDAHGATLSVRDYGIGISAEDQRYLFQPFHRARLAKETIPGAGLGLYVVRRLVEAHGGRIEVSSSTGQGALFEVYLPALGAEQTHAEAVNGEERLGRPGLSS
jgi:signal transduction histidine kinase